jgi:8-oxo-dGTP pyrophosphatase MutT (NUDIX family)
MVVREQNGLEVLLLKRSMRASFVPGAFVFPGGVIDPQDREIPDHCWVDGEDKSGNRDQRVERRTTVAAALRECFEETGLLPAAFLSSRPLGPLPEKLFNRRVDVHNNVCTLADAIAESNVQLDDSMVRPWSRWITPSGSPRRYDTRFFVTKAPNDQTASPDGHELTEAVWIRPNDALTRFAEGSLPLIFPTIKSLESLLPFTTIREIFRAIPESADIPGGM